MSRCVILAAGPVADVEPLKAMLRPDDRLIAADGGWRLAQRLGVTPSVLVADFDSMPPVDLPQGVQLRRLPVRKDVTDNAAAAEIAYEDGCRDFLFFGWSGGRLDHQQGAILTAVDLAQKGCRVTLADSQNIVRVLTGPTALDPMPGWKLSLFAFGGTVRGLTLKNAAYELTNYDLSVTDPLCTSNEFTDKPCEITFTEGTLLLYCSKD